MSDRNHGIYWCPGCLDMCDSHLAEDADPEGDPTPDLECARCGYVWGPTYVVQQHGPTLIKPTLSEEDRERGMQRLAERTQRWASKQGYVRENFTDPTIRIPRLNQGG